MGLEFEENFFLRQLFRVVNFLVYRVRHPASAPGHLQHFCNKWGPLSQIPNLYTMCCDDLHTGQLRSNIV